MSPSAWPPGRWPSWSRPRASWPSPAWRRCWSIRAGPTRRTTWPCCSTRASSCRRSPRRGSRTTATSAPCAARCWGNCTNPTPSRCTCTRRRRASSVASRCAACARARRSSIRRTAWPTLTAAARCAARCSAASNGWPHASAARWWVAAAARPGCSDGSVPARRACSRTPSTTASFAFTATRSSRRWSSASGGPATRRRPSDSPPWPRAFTSPRCRPASSGSATATPRPKRGCAPPA